MTAPTYMLTRESIVITMDGVTHTIRREAKNFAEARKAVLEERWDDVLAAVKPGLAIEAWLNSAGLSPIFLNSHGDWATWAFVNGALHYGGKAVDARLNERLIALAEEGANPCGWMNFWSKLQQNPSNNSINQLYNFLQHGSVPTDLDGDFYVYKSVRSDYLDHHSKTFLNTVGSLVMMPRNEISDDPHSACSAGLHVGAGGYVHSFGSDRRIMVCKVNPADVVSVPHDASAQKVRVCRYLVVAEWDGIPLPNTTWDCVYKSISKHVPDMTGGPSTASEADMQAALAGYVTESVDYIFDKEEAVDASSEQLDLGVCGTLWGESIIMSEHEFIVTAIGSWDHVPVDTGTTVSGFQPTDAVIVTPEPEKLPTTLADLNDMTLGELRAFAAIVLGIKGASKIPGGRVALMRRVVELLGLALTTEMP